LPSEQPSESTAQATRHISEEEAAGVLIGRYHLLQKIGEGGMGEVWLAEQREPVRRRAALKLVKSTMNTREAVARVDRCHLDRARNWLLAMYQAWGKPEKAAEWKRK